MSEETSNNFHSGEGASDPKQEPRASNAADAPDPDESKTAPATFERLYESEDGRLVLFQTDKGHLAAVDSSKLA